MANVVAFDTRPKQLSEIEALDWLRAQPDGRTSANSTVLAERWGWPRQRVARCLRIWQAEGLITRRGKILLVTIRDDPSATLVVEPAIAGVPAVPVAIAAAAPIIPAAASMTAPSGSRTTAAVVGGAALCLGAVGLILNAHFAASLGQTGLAAALLAAIGLALDVLAVALPTAASKLWHARHRPAALSAWLIWAGALAMMLLAGIGFASVNISDTVAGRSKVANEAVTLNVRLEQLRSERAAIGEQRSVPALEAELQRVQPSAQAVWKATNGCRDITLPKSGQICDPVLRAREAIGSAQQRDAIDGERRELERRLASLPAIRVDDPQARMTSEIVAWLSGGVLAPSVNDIHRLRIVGLTLAPAFAGLLLWMAAALWRRQPVRAVMS